MENDIRKLHNIDCISEMLRRDSRRDDIPENKEDITLIWLDENIDDSDYFKQTLNMFRQFNDYVLLYTNPQLCMNYIQSVVNEKIFLIISNNLAKTILPHIHSLDIVYSIFIFSTNDTQCNIDLNQYSKIVGIFIDQNLLIKSIKTHAYHILKQTIGFVFVDNNCQNSIRDLERNPASFLLFHKLISILKELPQTIQAKQEMIDVCKHYYQTNSCELNKIKQFEETYQSLDAIRWYTEDNFVHKLLNKALRMEDVSVLHLFRFYIIDLCKQIEYESESYLSSTQSQSHFVKLYRGQMMSEQEIDRLKKYIGNLISPHGFFSTSEDLNVALMFAGNDQSKSVLFEISIDRTITRVRSVISAAGIEQYSCFPEEKEVVFNLGTTFKLNDMFYDSHFKKWRVRMTATDQGLEYIQTHIDLMKNELGETTPATLFGELLIDMGQYSKAESYHRLVINTLSKDHDDIPLLYHGLGYIYYKRRQYDQALKYGGIAHDILRKTLPPNHLRIAQSYINLGWDHKRNGYPKRAIKLFKKALAIREMKYCGKDHMNTAIALISIGDTYTDLSDYQNAFDYLIRGLEMFQRVLPSEHFEISKTLMKIGNLFEKQSLFVRAMEYYHRGYNMAKKRMPIEHPRIIAYFENMMGLYKKMNNIEEATQFSNEHLALQCEVLGEIHPNIAQIHLVTGDVIIDIELKRSKYYQALDILEKFSPNDEKAIATCRSKIDAIRYLST